MIALAHALLFALAAAAGLPLGFALFGRRHPGGWIAGALFGYVLSMLAVWVPMRLDLASPLAFVIAWAIVSVAARLIASRLAEPLIALPPWTRGATAALASVLLLTLAIAVPPFWRAGEIDAAGNQRYRAYFTADFVWHMALTEELTKFEPQPRNPYLAPRPIHYYWAYFLPPAAAASALGRDAVQPILKVNAIGTAVLFVSAIFLCAWTAVPRAGPVAAAVALAIAASSAEGAFALWRFWQRGVPLSEVRNLNIDAIANWWFHGVRTDGLQRCFWWVPQHSMAYALGLVALTAVTAAGSGASMPAIVLAGVALAGSTMMNPFVGAVFCLVWGLAVVIDAARSDAFIPRVLRHAAAIVPVAITLGWIMLNRMAEGGGSALQFGWLGDARNAPLLTLVVSLGPALVPAAIGLIAAGAMRRPVAPAILAVAALLLLFFARLNVDPAWIGFRAGQLFLIAVPALIARALASTGAWRRVAIAVALAAVLTGVETTAIDVYNAQDTSNVEQSPNGPWTVVLTPDEQAGLDWIKRVTPLDAIVQMEPTSRERSTWSLIPSFAARRMSAGRPISLLGGTSDGSEYDKRSQQVRDLYATADAEQAHRLALSLRVDFLWVDATERGAFPGGMAKFDAAPQYFAPVYRNPEVTIYQVR